MASKAVAVVGDAIAVPAASFAPGPIVYTSYSNLSIGGTAVIYSVACTFTHSSTGATEPIVLMAGSTTLQKGSTGVLVNGDSQKGALGNELKIVASSNLLTA